MAKKSKKKYYVVWKGHRPGVYDNWQDCQAQIKGYPGAVYKSFTSLDEAKEAYGSSPDDYMSKTGSARKKGKKSIPSEMRQEIRQALSVDAACSGNPGIMEYRGVWVGSGKELFHQGPFKQGTNNVGEFLALVHALAYFEKKSRPDIAIYSDSKIAIGWVQKGKARTKLKKTPDNARLFELIRRAEIWLARHELKNPILKWNTREWGEIPADFGRK